MIFYNSFNYFQVSYDRNIKLLEEKNTIGIVLYKQDNKAVVEYIDCKPIISKQFFSEEPTLILKFMYQTYIIRTPNRVTLKNI